MNDDRIFIYLFTDIEISLDTNKSTELICNNEKSNELLFKNIENMVVSKRNNPSCKLRNVDS